MFHVTDRKKDGGLGNSWYGFMLYRTWLRIGLGRWLVCWDANGKS